MEMKGFTLQNWRLKLIRYPVEDAYYYDEEEGLIVVADGVTRDCLNGQAVIESLKSLPSILLYYPRPSPAKNIADLTCNLFPMLISDFECKDEKAIKQTFKKINEGIKNWNEKYKSVKGEDFDYLANDFPSCVAATTTIRQQDKQNILSYGFIGDCGIAVFDENAMIFHTQNETEEINEYIKQKGYDWRNSESRRLVRSVLRNNPQQKPSYGALTGEKWEKIEPYVKTGSLELKPNQTLVVYSDGLEKIIQTAEFRDMLKRKNFTEIKKFCQSKVRSEGTLVLGKNSKLNS